MIINLFHGTNREFTEFSNTVLFSKDSVDQYGSGFYFYSTPSKTTLHGGIIVAVKAHIDKILNYDERIELKRSQVEELILSIDNIDHLLEDFGDIEWEGYDKVLETAVNSYHGMDALSCLNSIGRDLVRSGEPTAKLLKAFKRITGYNCVVDLKRDIYLMLDKSDFDILTVQESESFLKKYYGE